MTWGSLRTISAGRHAAIRLKCAPTEAFQELWEFHEAPCGLCERVPGMKGEHHSLGTHDTPNCPAKRGSQKYAVMPLYSLTPDMPLQTT